MFRLQLQLRDNLNSFPDLNTFLSLIYLLHLFELYSNLKNLYNPPVSSLKVTEFEKFVSLYGHLLSKRSEKFSQLETNHCYCHQLVHLLRGDACLYNWLG